MHGKRQWLCPRKAPAVTSCGRWGLVRWLTSRPLVATTFVLVGWTLWLRSLPDECGPSDPSSSPWPLPFGLIPAVAIVEAWAARRRGGDALSMALWAVGTGAVVFAVIIVGALLHAGSVGCFD